MDPNVFRKGDSSSVLVVDKTWKEIIGKPDNFKELAERIVLMMNRAEETGLVKKSTTFAQFKDIINRILLEPLQEEKGIEPDTALKRDGTIYADALWEEIIQDDRMWEELKVAVERAYAIRVEIGESQPVQNSDKLQIVKDKFNDTIVKPLLGINEDGD